MGHGQIGPHSQPGPQGQIVVGLFFIASLLDSLRGWLNAHSLVLTHQEPGHYSAVSFLRGAQKWGLNNIQIDFNFI